MKQYMIINIVGEDTPGMLHDLSSLIAEHNCSIETSRMAILGGHLTMMLLISGSWNTIAKLEANLTAISGKYNLDISYSRTEKKQYDRDMLPYTVELVAYENPGILAKLTEIFASVGANIYEVNSHTYTTQTNTPMSSLTMRIHIPTEVQIAELRERILIMCDELNIDTIMEPDKYY